MPQEIERKFLLKSDAYKMQSKKQTRLTQGYISSVPERTVRIRIKGDEGFITIKGISDEKGISRYEWEKKIDLEEARELLKLCEPGVIDKIRYEVEVDAFLFEVDEFKAENQGLVVAEIELSNEDETYPKPEWLGEEVTGDPRYYNVALSKHPYIKW